MAQRRAEETRARILAAAEACFARGGYDATGVAEICQQAGVTKGALYHHFPTKQSIFMALLRDWLDRLDVGLEALRASAPTVPDGLLSMASMTRLIFQVGRGRLPMFLEFWVQASHDPEVWQATVEPYRRYRDLFVAIVRAGIAESTLRPVDPDTAAVVIVALAIGLLLQGLLDPQGADWGLTMENGMQMLLDGLGQHKTVGAGSPRPLGPTNLSG
jgi:TetR/AcrR family transcriptional repressor of uid operon